jgi:hypothetical protein
MKTEILLCDRCKLEIAQPATVSSVSIPSAVRAVLELPTGVIDLCIPCTTSFSSWFREGAKT